MSVPILLTSERAWQALLRLGEELVNLSTITDQCHLVEETIGQLFDARALLWISTQAYQLPWVETRPNFSLDEDSPIVSEVSKTRDLVIMNTQDHQGQIAGAPLLSQEIFLGVLAVERSAGQRFEPAELEFLQRAAALLAVAFQVTRQMAIKNWRFEQLALVRSVSSQIANYADLNELAKRVVRLIRDTFHYYSVAILTREEGQETLQFRASADVTHPEPVTHAHSFLDSIHLGEGIIGSVAQTGQELVACDVQDEPHYRFIDRLPETIAEACFPLKVEDRILGVIDLQSNRRTDFHETDILVLRSLADHIALAVEGARLYTRLRHRAEQLAAVAEVSRTLTSLLDPDLLLNEVVHLIQKRFGYPHVHVFSVHSGRRKVFFQAGAGLHSQALQDQKLTYDLDDPMGLIPWVASNGKSVLANDIRNEPLYRPPLLDPGDTRSELTVPLQFGGEVLGVLDIQSDQVNSFADEDRALLEALADSLSIALRNARLYQAERWRRQVADGLRDVAGMLSAEVSQEQVLDAILIELERNLPCEVAAIWLLEDEIGGENGHRQQKLRLAAVHGSDPGRLERISETDRYTQGLLIQSLELQQAKIRPLGDPVGPLGMALEYPPDYSSILAPLRAGERPLGILALAHHSPDRYGSEALSMTTSFASYAAVAIENNRLYATAQEQAWVSTVMVQVAEATQSLSTVEELLDAVVRLTPMLVGVQGCAVFLHEPTSDAFRMVAEYGLDPNEQADFLDRWISPGDAPVFDRLRQDNASILIHHDPSQFGLDGSRLDALGHKPVVVFPLLTRGEILGAFIVEHLHEHHDGEAIEIFTDEQLAILRGIVQQTAIAIENIRLLDLKQEEAYVTAVLLQVAQTIVTQSNLEDILDTIVHLMPILVGINASVIYLWDQSNQVFKPSKVFSGSWQVEAQMLACCHAPGEYPILDWVRDHDTLLMCPLDPPHADPLSWHQLAVPNTTGNLQEVMKSTHNLLLSFPLSVQGQLYGVMLAEDTGGPGESRERRLEIISGVAQQVSIAIQNHELHLETLARERIERELQLARQIQQSFLPGELPSPDGWQVDVRWRPARQVGGDFYDFFPLPENRMGLVIADVSDKGMPAAMYMTVARTLIRAAALEGEPPSTVMTRVNNLLIHDEPNSMFVTSIYAILDLNSGKIVYSNAGHNLPLLLRSNGKLERLRKGQIALGAWEKVVYRNQRVTLYPGDCLVLYTDGVTEAFSPTGSMYGEERLLKTVKSLKPAQTSQATNVIAWIDASVEDFLEGGPPTDDITLLAISRTTTA